MNKATERFRKWINRNEKRKKFFDKIDSFLFEYQTPRVVTMRTKRIGLLYRLVQATLLVYLVGYVLVYTKSYQKFEIADSSVVTRVKGVMKRNNSGTMELWDNNDFVVPAQESNAFFIATNLLYTYNQSQGICPEDPNVGKKGIVCDKDSDCPAEVPTEYGNGIKTGRCAKETGTCEIFAWCPTEIDQAPRRPVLSGFDSITVLVKNHIAFPEFGVKRRNVLDSFSEGYLKICRFHPIHDPICPVFRVKDMVAFAKTDFDAMTVKGGIIAFNIAWDCDLDIGLEHCLPHYSFRRLDSEQDLVAKGWNFRHAYYNYDVNGVVKRDLVKFWGIRFIFLVNARAGKFSTVNFIMHLGASLGLFGVASLICEIALGRCHHSVVLQEQKFVSLEAMKARRRSIKYHSVVVSDKHSYSSEDLDVHAETQGLRRDNIPIDRQRVFLVLNGHPVGQTENALPLPACNMHVNPTTPSSFISIDADIDGLSNQ